MAPFSFYMTILSFLLTMLLIFIRPKGINEANASVIGAMLVLFSGTVTLQNIADITSKVSGASITIITTIIMANVLESFGFFQWTAHKLITISKNSGYRLFVLTNLLCFLMTMLFNNDGSILITTPILILVLRKLHIKNHQMLPYLISGALMATAASVPIGVSNIVNLISLKIIGIDLYMYTVMMFVPGMLGLLTLFLLCLLVFHRQIPAHINYEERRGIKKPHHKRKPHPHRSTGMPKHPVSKFLIYIILFIIAIRAGLFIASFFGIPIEFVTLFGSIVLLIIRWKLLNISPMDMLTKTPWHIFIFAFCMYIIIYGLTSIGLADYLINLLEPLVQRDLFHAAFVMGGVLTLLSNVFNNHPALMIGTISLTGMELDPLYLQLAYLATIIGSDIGALLLPTGTLATLIWMHILKQERVKIKWKEYIKISFLIIPPVVILTIFYLYGWILLIL